MLKLATKCAPTAEALERAYRAGFRQVELYLDTGILADVQTALAVARHYPNEYALHFPNRLELPPAALDAVIELYRGLCCRALVVHQPMFDKFHADLLRREPGLRLAVENHRLTPDEFQAWAENNPGLTLDVEHLWKFTLLDGPLSEALDHVRTFLTRHGERLRHVHMPGYWPGLDEHRPMSCARELVFPVLTLLSEFQFTGLIVSEVRTDYQNEQDLRMDVLLFDRWRAMNRRLHDGSSSHPGPPSPQGKMGRK